MAAPSAEKRNPFPIGIRLNNPGNIRLNDIEWDGMTRLQRDIFVRFQTPEYGLRALSMLLINYKDMHGLTTVYEIINRYAPAGENDTSAYVRDVCRRTGFYANEILDMSDVFTIMKLAQAIVIHENGTPPADLPPAWYEEAIYHRAATIAMKDAHADN